MYDSAAKEMEDKRKDEPPPKLGPISKQIAAKAKLRPGMSIKLCFFGIIYLFVSRLRRNAVHIHRHIRERKQTEQTNL